MMSESDDEDDEDDDDNASRVSASPSPSPAPQQAAGSGWYEAALPLQGQRTPSFHGRHRPSPPNQQCC